MEAGDTFDHSSDPEPQATIGSGTLFAGYRIESEIGRGGMGVVYRARHLALDREYALKLISPALSNDPRFRERFQRESRLAASLEHPNLVAVDHAGDEGGSLYLAMRLVKGSDLRRIVEAEGPLDLSRAAEVLAGVAAGLDAAHAGGLIHRDVKPANVLIEDDGKHGRVFLTDFGVSRVTGKGGTVTSSGELLGSPDYMAPEQIAGEPVDHRADIYALGCLLYFALTGQPPFPRDNDMAKLFAHGNAPAAAALRADSLAFRARWTGSWRRRWRSTRRAATRTPARWPPTWSESFAVQSRSRRRCRYARRLSQTRRDPTPAEASPPPADGDHRGRGLGRRGRGPRIALSARRPFRHHVVEPASARGRHRRRRSRPHPPRGRAVASLGGERGASAIYAIDLVDDQQARPPVPTGGEADLGRGGLPFGLGPERATRTRSCAWTR